MYQLTLDIGISIIVCIIKCVLIINYVTIDTRHWFVIQSNFFITPPPTSKMCPVGMNHFLLPILNWKFVNC